MAESRRALSAHVGEKGLRWERGCRASLWAGGGGQRDPGTLVCLLGKNAAGAPASGRASEPGRGHESGPSQAGQMAGQLPDSGMGREPPEDRLGAWGSAHLSQPGRPRDVHQSAVSFFWKTHAVTWVRPRFRKDRFLWCCNLSGFCCSGCGVSFKLQSRKPHPHPQPGALHKGFLANFPRGCLLAELRRASFLIQ